MVSKQDISQFCIDSNKFIQWGSDLLNDFDLMLQFNNEKNLFKKNNFINVTIDKIKDTNYNVLNINRNDEVDYFNKFVLFKDTNYEPFYEIGEIIKNINEVN